MPGFRKDLLLDVPPYPATGTARLADRLAAIVSTSADVLIVQGEAIVALEAVATSLAHPGISALNVVTSPYGRRFGAWLRRGGAAVTDVGAGPGMPVPLDAFERALARHPSTNLVALAHAESASGILNPLAGIAGLARRHGALVVADAVASVGGHALEIDRFGIDVAVIGPQKALGGSPGLSAVSVSRRAWAVIDRADAPLGTTLSLLDLKRDWLDGGRLNLPGMPSALELFALEAALDRVEAEGIDRAIARHARARRAARAGLRALGLGLFVEDGFASNLVTTARPPETADIGAVLAFPGAIGAGLSAGAGDVADSLVRVNHTGMQAGRDAVAASVAALGEALKSLGRRVDTEAAAASVADAWDSAAPGEDPSRAGHPRPE